MESKLILGVTGHRLHLLPGYAGERSAKLRADLLQLAMDKMEEWHPDLVISGMATGWDMAMAGAAMLCNVPFHAYVPFLGQYKSWGRIDQNQYQTLLEEAADVRVISPVGNKAAYIKRDQAVVDASNQMLALYLGDPTTGTGQTLQYADEWLVPWSNVADDLLERQNGLTPE